MFSYINNAVYIQKVILTDFDEQSGKRTVAISVLKNINLKSSMYKTITTSLVYDLELKRECYHIHRLSIHLNIFYRNFGAYHPT